MPIPYLDRTDAGRQLAEKLRSYAGRPDTIVLALPRGGVPVGFEVARALGMPLDVFVVRKLGVPGHEELAMGAIASGGVRILNESVVRGLRIPEETIEAVTARESIELERRELDYRDGRAARALRGVTCILVDDGLATGSTMRAAVEALRRQEACRIVVAVPIASREVCEDFAREVDEIVCAETPVNLYAVGEWYIDFSQVSDVQVRELLARAGKEQWQPQ